MPDDRRPPHKTTTPNHKPPIGLIPMRALVGTARVMEAGNVGRAPGNFIEQPITDAIRAYDDAYARHRLSMQPLSGVVTVESLAAIDVDSGLPAIDHLIANLLILRTVMIRDGVLAEDPQVSSVSYATREQIDQAHRDAKFCPLCARDGHADLDCPMRSGYGEKNKPFTPPLIEPPTLCNIVTGTGRRCVKPGKHNVPGTAERYTFGYLHEDDKGVQSKD